MALITGDWRFPTGTAPPSLPEAAERLGRAMGLAVLVEGSGREAGLHIPMLRERLFDWRAEPGRLRLHSFAPAHPFLWVHLDAVLAEAGAAPRGPANARLRRPWSALSGRERLILRLPSLLLARPFDRFL